MVRSDLKEEAFQAAYETGRQMSVDEILAYALEEADQ
jgi:hypothetical protein